MTRINMDRRAASLCLVAAMLLTGACSRSEDRGSSSTSDSPTSRTSSPEKQETENSAKAVLDQAFTNREALGSGSGRLHPEIGNTLATLPKNVLSVTFAFVCTGDGRSSFQFEVHGKDVRSATERHTCDGSVFQHSMEVAGAGPVGFSADITGSDDGDFAYAYYIEKKQLD